MALVQNITHYVLTPWLLLDVFRGIKAIVPRGWRVIIRVPEDDPDVIILSSAESTVNIPLSTYPDYIDYAIVSDDMVNAGVTRFQLRRLPRECFNLQQQQQWLILGVNISTQMP